MLISLCAIILGLILLVWSANLFVDGASITAKFFGIPPLIIGMVIVGFGTSAPELFVSAISAMQNNSGIAIGNAYGSNIVNIALVLGITALMHPIKVDSKVLRKELPILTIATGIAFFQLHDEIISRIDSIILILIFIMIMTWFCYKGKKQELELFDIIDIEKKLEHKPINSKMTAFAWLLVGLIGLIIASRILVWGAVAVATKLGVSDLIIGLTIVALGTSLPELASSIIAAKKGEHDIAIGNIIGSNLFNTLMVVGLAGTIHPINIEKNVIHRDIIFMGGLTLSIFVFGYRFRKKTGHINKTKGILLLLIYIIYIWTIINTAK